MKLKEKLATLCGAFYALRCRLINNRLTIGRGIKRYAKIEIMGPGRVVIGENASFSRIRGDSSQYVTIYTHHPEAVVSIGRNARLFAARISCRYGITIGDDVLIEESGIADTDFHSLDIGRGNPNEDPMKSRIRVGHRVSIGARSLISKGVTIGDDVIVCPGSVVVRSIPPKSIVAGNPARIVESSAK